MAICGMTKLEAVNEILEVANQGRFPAVDSSGTWPALVYGSSIAGQCEFILDRISRRIQTMGWPENTDFYTSYTPSGTPKVVALTNTVLWVRGSGASAYRNFTIRGVSGVSYIWDSDNRTNDFGSATPITVDQILYIDFDLLQPRTKDIVVAAAATIFQRRIRGSPDHDAYLKEERLIADLCAERIRARLLMDPINPSPMLAAVTQPQRQQ